MQATIIHTENQNGVAPSASTCDEAVVAANHTGLLKTIDESLKVVGVKTTGGSATVTVSVNTTGNAAEPQTVTTEAVEEGGKWKVSKGAAG